MLCYNEMIRSNHATLSRNISEMRKKMSSFSSGQHKLVFPHGAALHFFVIVITHDSTLKGPWVSVECYDSLRQSRTRSTGIHSNTEFAQFIKTFFFLESLHLVEIKR